MQTYIDYAPYADIVTPTNFTEYAKFDLKQLDRNIYIQFMSTVTHAPVSLASMDMERYGRMKFLMKHIDGFVEYTEVMNPCTLDDFLGRDEVMLQETN